jgi:hypothetical protein
MARAKTRPDRVQKVAFKKGKRWRAPHNFIALFPKETGNKAIKLEEPPFFLARRTVLCPPLFEATSARLR